MSAAVVVLSPEPRPAASALYDGRGRVALALVPAPQPRAASQDSTAFYKLADELVTWLDTREMTEPDSPERAECDRQAEEFAAQLAAKGDSLAAFLAHIESQIALAASEIKRMQSRKKHFENALETLQSYAVRVLEKLPEPKKGRQKVVGQRFTLTLRASDRVKLLDEAQIPSQYKSVTVVMPAPTWELTIDLHPQILEFVTKQEYSTRAADVKAALKGGDVVPGADLDYCNSLVVK